MKTWRTKMNRSLALVLTIVLVSLTGARAENLGVFGGHVGNHGCFFCHTPHSKGAIEVLNSGNSNLRGTQLGLSLGAGTPLPHTFNMQGAGQSLAGTLYLWANPVTQTTYTTWEGTTISAAGMTTKTAAVHTILCLSCHDSSMGNTSMGTLGGSWLGGCAGGCTPVGGTGNASFDPQYMYGIGQVFWTNNGANNGWSSVGSLQATHPVDVAWPTNGAYWLVTISGTTATFTDTSFALGDGNFGHPSKLYVQGSTAYVECTSCHEPHRYSEYAYQVGSVWKFGTTTDYLRGPYQTANGSLQANFCRECHYEKAMAYITAGGAAQ